MRFGAAFQGFISTSVWLQRSCYILRQSRNFDYWSEDKYFYSRRTHQEPRIRPQTVLCGLIYPKPQKALYRANMSFQKIYM